MPFRLLCIKTLLTHKSFRWRNMLTSPSGHFTPAILWNNLFIYKKDNETCLNVLHFQVKFTLKRRSDSHHSSSHHQSQSQPHTTGDRDSGRGSPTGSINSAIVRRRRHRASRSTFAWMTHGQTIHPKSQKNSIERLMKLILEQGEVIQQQLAKLRLAQCSF